MCVIAVIPAGTKADKYSLENCFWNNPDGAGFMFQHRKRNEVIIRKGFMTFNEFWKEFSKVPWNVDRVAHFRIATSGKIDTGCCHPFPVSQDYKDMRKTTNKSRLAVAHNGIIDFTEPTNKLEAHYSDTMAFVANYIYPMKQFIFNQQVGDLIGLATDSKFAIMDSNTVKLIGKFEQYYGAFYSNSSYMLYYDKYTKSCGYYDYSLEDDWKEETGPFHVAVSLHGCCDWDYAEEVAKVFEAQDLAIGDYWLGKDVAVYVLDKLPIGTTVLGHYWWQINDTTSPIYEPQKGK